MTETTTPNVCGVIVITPKGKRKPCTKVAGHDDPANAANERKHSTVVRKEYEPVTMDDMATFSMVDKPNERAALAPKNRPGVKAEERKGVILEYDRANLALFKAWIEAGKPEEYAASPVGKIHVSPAKVETTKFLIRKSAGFLNTEQGGNHKIGIQFGTDGVKDKNGRAVVSWRAIDKRERQTT